MRYSANRILFQALFFLLLFLIAGCSKDSGTNLDLQKALVHDAKSNLQATIAVDFSHLTIIKGSLGKFAVNKNNPQNLGSAIGATESMIFPEKYEVTRLTKMIDISADMKKDVITQPMLDIINSNREVLNHIYTSVLKPLAVQMENGTPVTADQLYTINELTRLLERMTAEYSNLSRPETDFNSNDALNSFVSLQDVNRALQKLKLPVIKQETP